MSAILNFQTFEFLRLIGFAPPVSVNMPNFIKIGQLKLWRTYDVFYFVFHYGGRLPPLRALDHPPRAFEGLYRYADWFNLNSSFELSII